MSIWTWADHIVCVPRRRHRSVGTYIYSEYLQSGLKKEAAIDRSIQIGSNSISFHSFDERLIAKIGCQSNFRNIFCAKNCYFDALSVVTCNITPLLSWLGEITREQVPYQCDQIWHNFKSIGQIFECLFSTYLAKFDPTVAKMFCFWACFHCCRWPYTYK